MNDFQLTKHNLDGLFQGLSRELETTPVLIIKVECAATGKWGMARLWRAWMASTAKWMADRGATQPLVIKLDGTLYGERKFNANDAHELFTHNWMGADKDGNRLSWAKKSHDDMRAATKGERFIAMLKHESWAMEKGILLFKPRDSEYSKLYDEQNN